MLKTHCISQLAAGHGNVVTIESGTGLADDIDFGDDKVADGTPARVKQAEVWDEAVDFGILILLAARMYWRRAFGKKSREVTYKNDELVKEGKFDC